MSYNLNPVQSPGVFTVETRNFRNLLKVIHVGAEFIRISGKLILVIENQEKYRSKKFYCEVSLHLNMMEFAGWKRG